MCVKECVCLSRRCVYLWGPQLSGCVTSHVEQASQGGSAVAKVSIIIFTPVGSHEVARETVSARALGWGVRGRSQTHSAALPHRGLWWKKQIPHLHQGRKGGTCCSGVRNLQLISRGKWTLHEIFFYSWTVGTKRPRVCQENIPHIITQPAV